MINHTSLIGHGFGQAELDKVEGALRSAFHIRFVFNQWTLGADFCTKTLGIPEAKLNDPTFDLLRHFGSAKAIENAGVDELAKIKGISATIARTIYEHLHTVND